ncbi:MULTISPECIES: hypothetical protein [Sphingobacterium]|uniref:hypothetical protein n=1 Tax=Sphingobacterium TaxID=28453 RepID=UPI00257B44BB|nr:MULTISPECIES: hypothetical protein [Sphingobacterium]
MLQLGLVASVKLPGKVENILKYVALGLGILETRLDAEADGSKAPPEVKDRLLE